MKENSNRRPVIVGLFVLLGIIFLLAGVLMIGNLHGTFQPKMQVSAFFDDVSGLQTGNNVWFSGVKIGTVGPLHFKKGSQVEVAVNIETKAQEYIRKNAKIKIGSDGLIGNKILIIYGGTTNAPPIEEGDVLEVEKSVSQDEMINTLQENNKNLLSITVDLKDLSQRVANGKGTVGKLLAKDDVYENIEAASASLRGASAQAEQLIRSLNQFSEGLHREGSLAHDLVNDTVVFKTLKASAQNFQQMTDTAGAVVSALKDAVQNQDSPMGVLLYDDESAARLKTTIENLETGSVKLNEDLEAAQHNFLLRGYFKKKDKEEKKNEEDN